MAGTAAIVVPQRIRAWCKGVSTLPAPELSARIRSTGYPGKDCAVKGLGNHHVAATLARGIRDGDARDVERLRHNRVRHRIGRQVTLKVVHREEHTRRCGAWQRGRRKDGLVRVYVLPLVEVSIGRRSCIARRQNAGRGSSPGAKRLGVEKFNTS